MVMRDPVIYRVLHATHHNTGDAWCIYPMYDFAHPLEDAKEGITHSLCTLEFEIHRPFYDWTIEHCPVPATPRQIEFSRLNLNYTVMSKRKLLTLVRNGKVTGWDDPRMPTLSGLRRRGYPAPAIRSFCRGLGITKFKGVTDIALLEARGPGISEQGGNPPDGGLESRQAGPHQLRRRSSRGAEGGQ